MSFLFARKYNDNICMFSDSKVTFSPNDEDILCRNIKKDNIENLKKFGIIKSVIVRKNICIGSAGVLEHFNELLEFVDSAYCNFDSILNKALEINKKYNMDTDFLIMSIENSIKKLVAIKDGKICETDSCWIGSKETFELLQVYRHKKENIESLKENIQRIQESENFFYKTLDERAFEYAISNTLDNTVGGIIVRCTEKDGEFRYSESLSTSVERSRKVAPNGMIQLYDEASEGGYTVHIYESNDIFCIYINQLRNGIRYECWIDDKRYNHLRFPKLYNIDEENFIKNFNIIEPAIILCW